MVNVARFPDAVRLSNDDAPDREMDHLRLPKIDDPVVSISCAAQPAKAALHPVALDECAKAPGAPLPAIRSTAAFLRCSLIKP